MGSGDSAVIIPKPGTFKAPGTAFLALQMPLSPAERRQTWGQRRHLTEPSSTVHHRVSGIMSAQVVSDVVNLVGRFPWESGTAEMAVCRRFFVNGAFEVQ